MVEARSSPRLRRRYKVTLAGTPAFTVDVGPGGFCTELMRVLPLHTPVQGALEVKGRPLAFAGVVAWSRRGDCYHNVRGKMGVRFTQPPAGLREALAAPVPPATARPPVPTAG